jgi:nicotinate-nucleotide adenylyltransferase
MARIGVFGGSFNPPHMGHLIVCQSILIHEKLQKILFVPSSVSPHKRDKNLLSSDLRLQMTKLAIQDNPLFEVSDIEIKRGGVSYTIDTLRVLKNMYPPPELFLIIGIDNWLEFKSWKNPEEILDLADLLVMTRPGYSQVGFEHCFDKKVKFVDVPNIGISGTMIRLNIKSGRSIKYLVPRSVEQFIAEHALYHE